MREKGKWKGQEVLRSVTEKLAETRRGRIVGVSVKKTCPIFSGMYKGDPDTKGRPQVDIVLQRGDRRFSLQLEEAEIIMKYFPEAVQAAKEEVQRMAQETKAWQDYKPATRESGSMFGDDKKKRIHVTGKTARKKLAGRAGATAHRARKAEKSAKSRAINEAMGQHRGK